MYTALSKKLYYLMFYILILPSFAQEEFKDELQKFQEKMLQEIQFGFKRSLPYHQPLTQQSNLFLTHFDWHSSVHAHFSILSISRLSGNDDYTQIILSRINNIKYWKKEIQLLTNPDFVNFEYPYGRSWLLLLLHELLTYHKENLNPELYELLSEFYIFQKKKIYEWTQSNQMGSLIERGKYINSLWPTLVLSFLSKDSNTLKSSETVLHHYEFPYKYSCCNMYGQEEFFFNPVSLYRILKNYFQISAKSDSLIQYFSCPTSQDLKDAFNRSINYQNEKSHQISPVITNLWYCLIENDQHYQMLILKFLNSKEGTSWNRDYERFQHWIPQFLWFGFYLSHEIKVSH